MSPYEAQLLIQSTRRVGFWATLRSDGAADAAARACVGAGEPGLADLRLFVRDLPRERLAFVSWIAPDPLTAMSSELPTALTALPWWRALSGLTVAGWQAMELITQVAHPQVYPHRPGAAVQRLGMVAGLHPASEVLYRSLHQTVWPGVIERGVRSNYRGWTSFLAVDGETMRLFTTVEYSGTDRVRDDADKAADPTTQRWWRHTEPCLIPLLPGGGSWAAMERLRPG